MAKTAIPGATVHEIFCVPPNTTIMSSPRVYSNGTDVSGGMTINAPSSVAGSSTTYTLWKVSYVVPVGATSGQVYHLIVDWKDPSGDLQPPFIFDAQVSVSGDDISVVY